MKIANDFNWQYAAILPDTILYVQLQNEGILNLGEHINILLIRIVAQGFEMQIMLNI